MFLPDRFIRASARARQGPVRRQLRGLRRRLPAHRPEEPVLPPVRRHAGAEDQSEHFFFSDPRCVEFLQVDAGRPPAARGGEQDRGMVRARRRRREPGRLGHQPRRALLRHRDPGRPGKYFYVWLDAPVGYLASLKNLLDRRASDYDAYLADPGWSRCTSSARTSSPSTRCSGRRC